MTKNEFQNLIAFCILMEYQNEILDKSPDYVLEKFNRYIGNKEDAFNWGLDQNNQLKLAQYLHRWGKNIESLIIKDKIYD